MTCVTPTHHDPLGMPMSVSRRQELLAWAITNKGMILEDDVDSLFRYTTRPLPSLQGLDPSKNSVVYLSSFDKVLSPLMQLSFAVFPHSLLPLVANAKSMLQPNAPLIDQMVLADLIREGHLERHIRRSAVILSRRRNALITALTRCFGRKVWIARESAGTHIFVRLSTGWIDSALVQAAKSSGLAIKSTREYYLADRPPTGQFIISFAGLDELEAHSIVERFAQAIE
jgi:GntR family transcriptional regulator / MocR family aminotransferase